MASEPPPLPASKPVRRFQVVHLMVGVLAGVGISMVLVEFYSAFSVHAQFLRGSGEYPWWVALAMFPLDVMIVLAIILVPPVGMVLWLRHREASVLLAVGGVLSAVALSIAVTFFRFQNGVFHPIDSSSAMVAGMLYDVSRREDPERVVAWAREVVAKVPDGPFGDEVADSDVPDFVKLLWDGPRTRQSRYPHVSVSKSADGNAEIRVMYGGGFFGWGFQITPGKQSLDLNHDRVRGRDSVYWTREIRIFAGG